MSAFMKTYAGLGECLSAERTFFGVAPPFDAIDMGLFENNATPSEGTTYSDLVECTFPGYARQNLGYLAGPYWVPFGASGYMEMAWGTVIFTNTNPAVAYTPWGFFVSRGGTLLGSGLFSGAPALITPLGFLAVNFVLRLGNAP